MRSNLLPRFLVHGSLVWSVAPQALRIEKIKNLTDGFVQPAWLLLQVVTRLFFNRYAAIISYTHFNHVYVEAKTRLHSPYSVRVRFILESTCLFQRTFLIVESIVYLLLVTLAEVECFQVFCLRLVGLNTLRSPPCALADRWNILSIYFTD